jgi:hypothetical protein
VADSVEDPVELDCLRPPDLRRPDLLDVVDDLPLLLDLLFLAPLPFRLLRPLFARRRFVWSSADEARAGNTSWDDDTGDSGVDEEVVNVLRKDEDVGAEFPNGTDEEGREVDADTAASPVHDG